MSTYIYIIGFVDDLKRTQATADELTQQVLCLESQLENSTANLQEEKVNIYIVICNLCIMVR
jgi:hypothetical protein